MITFVCVCRSNFKLRHYTATPSSFKDRDCDDDDDNDAADYDRPAETRISKCNTALLITTTGMDFPTVYGCTQTWDLVLAPP